MTQPPRPRELTDVEKEARRLVTPAVRELRDLGCLGVLPVAIEDVIQYEFPLEVRKVEGLTFADVRRVAGKYQVEIQEEPPDTALAGYLLVGQDWGVVLLNQEAGNPDRIWRQRFSAAHELGHYMMEARVLLANAEADEMLAIGCSYADMNRREFGADAVRQAEERYLRYRNEALANMFAAEALMPYDDARAFVSRRPFSMRTVDEMAERFETSLMASARRYVATSDEDCAVVFTKDRMLQMFDISPSLAAYGGRYTLPRQHRFGAGTAAELLVTGQMSSANMSGSYFAMEWFPYCRDRRRKVREFSRRLSSTGTVISLLWFEGGAESED